MALVSKESQKVLSLDLYDEKIIFYLSQNSRMPVSQLAKKLRISSQRAQYKINRLTKELLEPAAFMNFNLLDIPSYMIYFEYLPDEIISKLIESDEVYFLMQSIGKYSWVLNIVTEDIQSFCLSYLANVIFEVYPIVRSIPDNYNPFNLSIKPLPLVKNRKINFKQKEYVLLEYLSKNPLDSILQISQKTGLDRKTIREKIKLFLSTNTIQKFRYAINIFKLGRIAYLLRISVTPRLKSVVLEHIRSNNYSGFVFESFTNYSMHYLPPSHNELFEFINSLEKLDSSIHVDVMQNTEFFKVQLVPNSVVKIFNSRAKLKK